MRRGRTFPDAPWLPKQGQHDMMRCRSGTHAGTWRVPGLRRTAHALHTRPGMQRRMVVKPIPAA